MASKTDSTVTTCRSSPRHVQKSSRALGWHVCSRQRPRERLGTREEVTNPTNLIFSATRYKPTMIKISSRPKQFNQFLEKPRNLISKPAGRSKLHERDVRRNPFAKTRSGRGSRSRETPRRDSQPRHGLLASRSSPTSLKTCSIFHRFFAIRGVVNVGPEPPAS